jgi:histidinol-phosphate aminotransferase
VGGEGGVTGASHGGPDEAGVPRWDFSTNANACGPAPYALAAVQRADATRYPDPACTALRERLAGFHGVAPGRIVVAGSASEFIFRMSIAVARRWPQASVYAPSPGYGDYARAAQAARLRPAASPGDAMLVWHTEPGSPDGHSRRAPAVRDGAVLVVDRAYAPLRLEGEAPALPPQAWQLWSPNKALGLTGVRGAYAIAPTEQAELLDELHTLAPSWPLGAHGVALLDAWASPETQAWVTGTLPTLRAWKREQLALCAELGWACDEASVVPFHLVRGPDAAVLARLRAHGVKLRDTHSMGLSGHVRMSVQPPAARQALRELMDEVRR